MHSDSHFIWGLQKFQAAQTHSSVEFFKGMKAFFVCTFMNTDPHVLL
jgi:hypothetical protein